jgi:hypothetical protein
LPSIDINAAALCALASIHNFSTKYIEHLAHVYPRHAGLFHMLGEVRVVFAFLAFTPLRPCRPPITVSLCRCGRISACSQRSSLHAFAKSLVEQATPVFNGKVPSVRCKTLTADHHVADIRPAWAHQSP